MAESATFAVKQSERAWQRVTLLGIHVIAGAVGGVIAGAVIGMAGAYLPSPARYACLLVAIAAAVWDFQRRPMYRLQPPHGVPAEWIVWPAPAYLSAYGVILGAGLFTPYTAAAMYALVGLVLAQADPLVGAVILGGYGGVRALASMFAAVAGLSLGIGEVTRSLQRARATWRPILGFLAVLAIAAAVFA